MGAVKYAQTKAIGLWLFCNIDFDTSLSKNVYDFEFFEKIADCVKDVYPLNKTELT